MAATITVDELLAELTRLGVGGRVCGVEGVRSKDLQQQWGVSDKKVREIMGRACEAGLAVRDWVTIRDGWGKETRVQGYRFTLPEKTTAKARK